MPFTTKSEEDEDEEGHKEERDSSPAQKQTHTHISRTYYHRRKHMHFGNDNKRMWVCPAGVRKSPRRVSVERTGVCVHVRSKKLADGRAEAIVCEQGVCVCRR